MYQLRNEPLDFLVTFILPDCDGNVDLYFVVDSSESIIQDDPYGKPLYHWERVKGYLRGVVGNLPVSSYECHIGMIKYSDEAHLEFGMQRYNQTRDIDAHIQGMIHIGGNTDTARALESVSYKILMPEHGARNGVRKVVVLLTDGLTNREQNYAIQKASFLKGYGVEIFVVCNIPDLNVFFSNIGYTFCSV